MRIEEPIGNGQVVLQVPIAPHRDRRGRLVALIEVWSGGGLFNDEVVLSQGRAREKFAAQAASRAGEDAQDIANALTALYFKLNAQISALDTAAEAPAARKQQSLAAPGLVCAAEDNGQHVYIALAEGGALVVRPSILGDYRGERVEHVPPRVVPWVLPCAERVLEHYRDLCNSCDPYTWLGVLLKDLEQWHKDASDLGTAVAYTLLALYDLATYAFELLDYLAILLLEAEPERGKSRTGQAASAVMRHGIWLQGIREANLLRAASDRQASIFIDVMDVWKKAEAAGCEDILLGRWERGGTVERVLYPDKGPFEDTVIFNVFSGGTIVATNEEIHRILDTRCLRIDMPLTTKRFSGRVQPEAARPLIERLMAWRAYVLQHGLADADAPADGRLGDILRPIKQVLLTVAPDRIGEFGSITDWQTKRRTDDLTNSIEAAIVRALSTVWAQQRSGQLPLQTALNQVNAGWPADRQKTARWLGGKLRNMGWTIERVGHDNERVIVVNDILLAQLRLRYGLDDYATPPPSCNTESHRSHRSHSSDRAATDATDSHSTRDPSDWKGSHDVDALSSGETYDATGATGATRCWTGAAHISSGQRPVPDDDLDEIFPPSGYGPEGRDAF
jgi:hypothetical protein